MGGGKGGPTPGIFGNRACVGRARAERGRVHSGNVVPHICSARALPNGNRAKRSVFFGPTNVFAFCVFVCELGAPSYTNLAMMA